MLDEMGTGYGNILRNPLNETKADPIIEAIRPKKETNTETNQLAEQNIIEANIEDIANKEQKELWEREDAIRAEIQAREDNAYQRAVADMKQAGVNPNLQSISGASSGGGITTATKKDLTRIENAKDRELEKLIQEIQNNWQGTQNNLDRVIDGLKTLNANVQSDKQALGKALTGR